MLQTTTPTHTTYLTSVVLSAGQRVPLGARVLGIFATVPAPSGARVRARVVNFLPHLGMAAVIPLHNQNEIFLVDRSDMRAISAIIETGCK
jgi:hypothetical protein